MDGERSAEWRGIAIAHEHRVCVSGEGDEARADVFRHLEADDEGRHGGERADRERFASGIGTVETREPATGPPREEGLRAGGPSRPTSKITPRTVNVTPKGEGR
jgi:hypothetical protein